MKTISATYAKWKLRKYLKSRIFWTRKILLFDGEYELVNDTKLTLEPVSLGSGECDDRAWVMMSRVITQYPRALFGFVEGYDSRNLKHAWCFMMDQYREVWYVEPSTAVIYSPSVERIYHFIR